VVIVDGKSAIQSLAEYVEEGMAYSHADRIVGPSMCMRILITSSKGSLGLESGAIRLSRVIRGDVHAHLHLYWSSVCDVLRLRCSRMSLKPADSFTNHEASA
jgi:hypothetical protein